MINASKILFSTMILCLAPLLSPHAGCTTEIVGTTLYVSDFLVINLRDRIEPPYSVVSKIRTDEPLTVVEEAGNYYKVQTNENKTGWVSKQFTTPQTPKSIVIQNLTEKISQLEAQDGSGVKDLLQQKDVSEKNLLAAEEKIQELTNQLEQVQISKESIQATSPDQQPEVSQELEALKQSANKQKELITTLQQENHTLKFQNTIYWFLAGGFLLFFGILLGKISSKRQKKFSF